ncbi:CopD family protein [Stakelama tenebrarum]|uniref:Protoporphyrinogen IX oxidase n=1 Tax=Stakelama tenebrarum TaxID=2711215 RepID=A0A6G6Y0V6_9SPHN|nr:CopD family protein [Sphingosinithalassobacter tenebrarum]QIG78540.1 CopD family protein [Sphingosinithalassobacter tenebrarum]
MTGFLGGAYLWVKALHIIFVIFWMAGLFLLPRYLIHHQDALARPDEAAQWVDREKKLRGIILTPSLIIVWLSGLAIALSGGWFTGQGWLHAKLLLVVLLSGFHGWAVAYSKKLAAGKSSLASRQLRMLNEVPGVAVVLIVILAVVRPF